MSNKPTGDNLSEDFFTEWRNHDEAKYRLAQAAPELMHFARLVADTGFDGRVCSHDEGCHDHDECRDPGCIRTVLGQQCDCPLGECCAPWDMSTNEEHDNLVDLVLEAKAIIGRMQL